MPWRKSDSEPRRTNSTIYILQSLPDGSHNKRDLTIMCEPKDLANIRIKFCLEGSKDIIENITASDIIELLGEFSLTKYTK